MGHERTTVAANLVLHVAVPAVVVGLYAWHRAWAVGPTAIATTMVLPVAYLVWALLETALLGMPPVYIFLDVAKVGVLGVVAATVAGALVYWCVGWL